MTKLPFENGLNLADLDTIGIRDNRGNPALRFGHYINLALEGGDTKPKRHALVAVISDYAKLFEGKITHYFPYESAQLESIKDFDFISYFRKRTEIEDDLSQNEGFEAALYGFPTHQDNDEPTLYYASVSGETKLRRFSSVDVYLPASWAGADEYGRYIETVRRWCSLVKPSYGTAGLSILFNEGQQGRADRLEAFPIAKRFVGFDLPESDRWFAMMGRDGRRAIRTINWLTIIDDRFVDDLGGLSTLKEALGPSCVSHIFDGGVILQAGEKPLIGDANQGLVPEAYRKVARALRPIRFEAYARPLIDVPAPLDPIEETLRWVRRFD